MEKLLSNFGANTHLSATICLWDSSAPHRQPFRVAINQPFLWRYAIHSFQRKEFTIDHNFTSNVLTTKSLELILLESHTGAPPEVGVTVPDGKELTWPLETGRKARPTIQPTNPTWDRSGIPHLKCLRWLVMGKWMGENGGNGMESVLITSIYPKNSIFHHSFIDRNPCESSYCQNTHRKFTSKLYTCLHTFFSKNSSYVRLFLQAHLSKVKKPLWHCGIQCRQLLDDPYRCQF